jgi:hypothetical protein
LVTDNNLLAAKMKKRKEKKPSRDAEKRRENSGLFDNSEELEIARKKEKAG